MTEMCGIAGWTLRVNGAYEEPGWLDGLVTTFGVAGLTIAQPTTTPAGASGWPTPA